MPACARYGLNCTSIEFERCAVVVHDAVDGFTGYRGCEAKFLDVVGVERLASFLCMHTKVAIDHDCEFDRHNQKGFIAR